MSHPDTLPPLDLVDSALGPDFALSCWPEEDGAAVSLLASYPENPNPAKHASMALLYGLAIMTLDQQGVLDQTIDRLLAAGPISEPEAVARITLLLKEDQNDQPV